MNEFKPGDQVYYDDDPATVLERIPSGRTGSDDYRVRGTNGTESVVWGSDLVPGCACTGFDGCPNPAACGTPQGCHCGA